MKVVFAWMAIAVIAPAQVKLVKPAVLYLQMELVAAAMLVIVPQIQIMSAVPLVA